MNEVTPVIDVDEQIEAIAKDIEALQATTFFRIAERLAEAHELFRYKRDEGGFAGWVETRLRYSRATAYRLLDVHEKLGDKASKLRHFRRARSIFSPRHRRPMKCAKRRSNASRLVSASAWRR